MKGIKLHGPIEIERDLGPETGKVKTSNACPYCDSFISIPIGKFKASEIIRCPHCNNAVQLAYEE